MLDTTTKRRIDTARDILVGKVPDPKSQVEQITIALIYKFMDDMDLDAEELGGEPSFFSGEYEKYGWRKIFNPSLGGFEMLSLYSEAILKMAQNPNLPQLFRDIFKNAYLPYRDPETLKSFLKIINDFSYDHSEKLGDAFEYLLSVLGSQGDAGQFRTPRHVIDFMTALIAPKKNETVLDPACGTAGFLISAYKHILKENSTNYDKTDPYTFEQNNVKLAEITVNGKHYKGDKLSPDDRARIIQNIKGYDISPDMVRLSLVNLYLHGFTDPHIHEYDTLTSEERWNEFYDIILANPPFMSPKGGIRPHKRFAVQSKRSEVLFVDYMAEHLTPTGKAAIIVPEGIIFQSGTAYKSLRKMLVEDNYLVGVISLPAGVFNPYSGVKTSILWLDKTLAKKTDKILFAKIENDGFDLGAQRRPIKQNDLPGVFRKLTEYRDKLMLSEEVDFENEALVSLVEKDKIAENGEFNLLGSRYHSKSEIASIFDKVKLEEVLDYEQPTNYIVEREDYDESFKTPVLTAGKSFILGYTNEEDGIYNHPLPVIIFDDFTTASKLVDFPFKVKSSAMKILKAKESKANITFLYYLIQHINFDSSVHKRYWISQFSKIQIPLPPLSVQEEIVAEIESYQKIIDGARQVVENYKPKIDIDPEWEMVELGDICDITSSKRIFKDEYVESGVPFYRTKEIVELSNGLNPSLELFISNEKYQEIKEKFDMPKQGDILVSAVGTLGVSWIVNHDNPFYFKDGNLVWLKDIKEEANPNFVKQVLDIFIPNQIHILSAGAAYKALTIVKLKQLKIPLPNSKTQNQIVAQIEKEQALVNSNKQLIEIYEQKIKDRIAKVWGV